MAATGSLVLQVTLDLKVSKEALALLDNLAQQAKQAQRVTQEPLEVQASKAQWVQPVLPGQEDNEVLQEPPVLVDHGDHKDLLVWNVQPDSQRSQSR